MPDQVDINRHGQIVGGTVAVHSLARTIDLYGDYLHQELVDEGTVSTALATAWGAPNTVGARYAVMQSAGAASVFRFVEGPIAEAHVPARSIGWNAFELSVGDVFALADKLSMSDFEVVGPPKLVDGFTSFIPMQVFGPNGEVLFLNQINHSDDDADLPQTDSPVGDMFIVVLASRDRRRSVDDYARRLQLHEAATHELRYSLLNRAFGLPAETKQTITMVQNQRIPFAQIDQYPSGAESRSQARGYLPAGNAMVSVYVDNLDSLSVDDCAVAPTFVSQAVPYEGRSARVIRGTSGELIELIDTSRVH